MTDKVGDRECTLKFHEVPMKPRKFLFVIERAFQLMKYLRERNLKGELPLANLSYQNQAVWPQQNEQVKR